MRESISALTQCAGAGAGTHMRARAVCVHAALKLAARLLRACERRGDRTTALAVSTIPTTYSTYYLLYLYLSNLFIFCV